MSQQNLQIQIQDDLEYDIRIENADLDCGQFYREGDQNDILVDEDVDGMVIRHNGGIRNVCSMYESQGSIDLVDDVRDAKICSLAWRASMHPEERNEFQKLNNDPRYTVEISDWKDSGPMGVIPVTVKEQE